MMSQNGKLKFFAPSSYDDEPLEPPPAYSATPHPAPPSLPSTFTGQQTMVERALLAFRIRIQEATTRNHQVQLGNGTEENREVRRQLLHIMSEFLGKVSRDSPKSIKDLPASVHGVLKADLYVAPQEAVPLSSGWHLSGVSQKDDEIIGRAVQEGRVWPTETQYTKQKKEAETNGTETRSKPEPAAGLWFAVDALSLNEAVVEPRGTLWWNNEREAQELARNLDVQLAPQPSGFLEAGIHQGDENENVQVRVRADYMTFRRENEMGLWESKSGWTMVMAVTLLY